MAAFYESLFTKSFTNKGPPFRQSFPYIVRLNTGAAFGYREFNHRINYHRMRHLTSRGLPKCDRSEHLAEPERRRQPSVVRSDRRIPSVTHAGLPKVHSLGPGDAGTQQNETMQQESFQLAHRSAYSILLPLAYDFW